MPIQTSGGEERSKRMVGIYRYNNEPPGVTCPALFSIRLGLSSSETRKLVRAEALSHTFFNDQPAMTDQYDSIQT